MRRGALLLLILLAAAACGRPLTHEERAFAATIHGDQIDPGRVRVMRGALVGSVTFRRPVRPRTTCREKILPPIEDEFVTSRPAAVVLFNGMFFTRDWYAPNYAPRFPERLFLLDAMLFAHELTHVWQWQNRARTGYHPLRAAAEQVRTLDPYLVDLGEAPAFLDFGYEQQGAIVEEYVCCRALDPAGARTRRLHDMLRRVLPVSDLPASRAHDVVLPWRGAEVGGICS